MRAPPIDSASHAPSSDSPRPIASAIIPGIEEIVSTLPTFVARSDIAVSS